MKRNPKIPNKEIAKIILPLRVALEYSGKKDYERSAMKILNIMSFRYLPILHKEMDDDLLHEILEYYISEDQDLKFKSVCILGNLAGMKNPTWEILNYINTFFIKKWLELLKTGNKDRTNKLFLIWYKIADKHPGTVSFSYKFLTD